MIRKCIFIMLSVLEVTQRVPPTCIIKTSRTGCCNLALPNPESISPHLAHRPTALRARRIAWSNRRPSNWCGNCNCLPLRMCRGPCIHWGNFSPRNFPRSTRSRNRSGPWLNHTGRCRCIDRSGRSPSSPDIDGHCICRR